MGVSFMVSKVGTRYKHRPRIQQEEEEEKISKSVVNGAPSKSKVRRNLYWTPCAAHCIDLMLKDIANDPHIEPLIRKSQDMTCFIYNHGWALSIMRTETQNGELVRPAITRFATNFIAFDSILKHQADLKRMINTRGWTDNYMRLNRKDREKADVVVSLIESQTYWRDIAGVTAIFRPIVKVLRMVDSDDKAEMGHLYEAMDRAKEMIKKNVGQGYRKWWEMIDTRWNSQLHRDIHAAGYFLNPKYQYSNDVINDDEVLNGFHRVVNRMVNDNTIRLNINKEVDTAQDENDVAGKSASLTCFGGPVLPDLEKCDVSFTLNLFQNGYFIGKPTEVENLQLLMQDGKSLHPYDRGSENLFAAIQAGWLPGDILDDIPSKFINGSLVCEVRDFRKCITEGSRASSTDRAVVYKVQLRMSLENVVKDIPLISDDSWTYSDLMEVESRILKALQPELCLDPAPKLDRLCNDPRSIKLDLCFGRKRLRQTPEVTVTSNSQNHGKKVCIDGAFENTNGKPGDPGIVLGNAAIQGTVENAIAQHGIPPPRPNNSAQEIARTTLPMPSLEKFQPAVNYPGLAHDRGTGSPANFGGMGANVSSPQSLMSSYTETGSVNPHILGKRDNQDAQMVTASGLKRSKQTPTGLDGIQQQQLGPQFVGLSGQDMQWKNQLLRSQLDANRIQYSSAGGRRYPPQVMNNNISSQEAGTSFHFNQQGLRYCPKGEQSDTDKLNRQELEKSKDPLQPMTRENNALNLQESQPQLPEKQPSMRNNLPPLTHWHNPRLIVDKDMIKDDILQKRKTLISPRVSSGPMSPVSSKSGDISSGSVGGQFSAVATTSALGSQKATTNSNAALGAPSSTSSPNDSVYRQPPGRRKSNSAQKTQAMSGVGSPASVGNMNTPLNASSPSIGTVSMGTGDQVERFAKIEMLTKRHQLNLKKKKVDDYPAKKYVGCPIQHVAVLLKNSYNNEDFVDEMKPLSRSHVGGNINNCRTRVMTFVRNECHQAVPLALPTRAHRLVMAEKHSGGTVAMQYGDGDDYEFSSSQDCLLILPTSNQADLLASQFCMLMERDGYKRTDDQVRALPSHLGLAAGSSTEVSAITPDNVASEIKQHEVASSPSPNVSTQPNNSNMGSLNPSQNLPNSARMLGSGTNGPALPISQGYLPGGAIAQRPQQPDEPLLQQQKIQQQQQSQQQQQQQQLPSAQIQRTSSMLSANPLSQLMGHNSNLQMNANPMINNKPNSLQLQMMQQQQMQRKAMLGINAATMGNMTNNNIVGISGLGIMGMGGPMTGLRSMSGLGNVRPNQANMGSISNFGSGIRPSAEQAAAAMAQNLKQAHQNRAAAGIYGGQAGMVGGNPMLPSPAGLSMLGNSMNRANMTQLHRNAMASMGPPKIPGTNYYLNQQQQFHLQQQYQLQQQQQQQIGSPLQNLQVRSPSLLAQQQMSQQTALSPQLSSGALQQQMNNSGIVNLGRAGPGSPQLSSQTLGSIGSISSSPMELLLQGAGNMGGNV